jgi:hypothetical protein
MAQVCIRLVHARRYGSNHRDLSTQKIHRDLSLKDS